jgi:hypothetical protein
LKSDTEFFSIRGKDWGADFILFIDHTNTIFYIVKAGVTTLGKKPKHRNDERKVSVVRVMKYSYFTSKSEIDLKIELKKIINPKFKDILKDLDSPYFSIFKKNNNEITKIAKKNIKLSDIPIVERKKNNKFNII